MRVPVLVSFTSMRTRVMSEEEKAREERRPGREAGEELASSTAMEKEALAVLGALSEPLLLQPEAMKRAGKRRRSPSGFRGRHKFHEQVIAILS
jgi:hypothetical protein